LKNKIKLQIYFNEIEMGMNKKIDSPKKTQKLIFFLGKFWIYINLCFQPLTKNKKKPLQRLKSKAQLQEHIPKIQESSTQIQPKLKNSLSSPQPVPKLYPPKNQIIAN
jgi:hypothetical protein